MSKKLNIAIGIDVKVLYALPLYVGIILQQDNRVLLIQRKNSDWMSGYWNFPGGLVEKDESLLQAAIREAREEIGVIISPQELTLIQVLHVRKGGTNTKDIIGFYFHAKSWQGIASNNEPDKIRGVQWFSLDALPVNITEHALSAINGLLTHSSYAENGW